MNKWVKSTRLHSLLIPPESTKDPESILIKRANAHGDVLIAAGVCAALKKKYPTTKIAFSSLCLEAIQGNPYIDEYVEIKNIKRDQYRVIYDLDLAYEWRPNINILTSYAEFCGVKNEDCVVFSEKQEYTKDELPEDFIVIHPGATNWVGRDWPHENFVQVANKLLNRGEKVVCIGKYTEKEIPCTLDVRGDTSIAQMAWIISKSKLFVGIDSFPMHIAQAVNVPGIAFFGSVKPDLRIYNKKMTGITAENLECLGCHHRKPAPSTVTKTCETGTFDCIKNVSVRNMMKAINKKLDYGDKDDLVSLMG